MNITKHTTREHRSKKLLGLLMAILLLSSFGFGMFWINVSQVQAQTPDTYTLLEPLPCIPKEGETTCSTGETTGQQITKVDFQGYVQYMFNLLIALAAVAAVFMIVWGGFQYMSSDSFYDKKEGRQKLINALSGLLLVLCSYLILKTIDPRLVAIPVNLVEKLEIKCTDPGKENLDVNDPKCVGANISGFFDQLVSDAENYKIARQELIDKSLVSRANWEKYKKTDGELKDELDDMYYMGYKDGDPQVEKLKAEIAKNANDLKAAEMELVINSRTRTIMNEMTLIDKNVGDALKNAWWYQTDIEVILRELDKAKTNIETFRKQGNDLLIQNGQSTDTPGGINDYANYAEINIEISRANLILEKTVLPNTPGAYPKAYSYKQKMVIGFNELRAELLENINGMSAKIDSGGVKDPALKGELQAKLKASQDLINKKFPGQ